MTIAEREQQILPGVNFLLGIMASAWATVAEL